MRLFSFSRSSSSPRNALDILTSRIELGKYRITVTPVKARKSDTHCDVWAAREMTMKYFEFMLFRFLDFSTACQWKWPKISPVRVENLPNQKSHANPFWIRRKMDSCEREKIQSTSTENFARWSEQQWLISLNTTVFDREMDHLNVNTCRKISPEFYVRTYRKIPISGKPWWSLMGFGRLPRTTANLSGDRIGLRPPQWTMHLQVLIKPNCWESEAGNILDNSYSLETCRN